MSDNNDMNEEDVIDLCETDLQTNCCNETNIDLNEINGGLNEPCVHLNETSVDINELYVGQYMEAIKDELNDGFNDTNIYFNESTDLCTMSCSNDMREEDVIDLSETNDGFNETNINLDETNDGWNETNINLNEINDGLTETNINLDETNDGWNETNINLNEINDGLTETNINLNEINDGWNETNIHLNEINDGLTETNINLDETNDGCNETNINFNDINDGLNETNINLNEINDGLNDTNINLNERNDGLYETNINFDETNDGLNETNINLNEINDGLNETNINLNETNVGLNEICIELNVINVGLNETSIDLSGRNDGLNETCVNINEVNVNHDMEAIRDELNKLVASMSQLNGKRRGVANATGSSSSGTSSSSTSSNPTTTTMSTDLASLFECPVCFDYVLPPILQCQSGHLVCSNCRPKLTCCPTCRGQLGNIRNLAMEKVASNVMFPCKHSSTGCSVSLIHTEKAEHEEACEFRPYSCPCPGASCRWQGSLEQVMPHLMMSHKSITTLQGEDIVFLATDINLPGAVDWVMMQSCFGHHFMLVLEKQEKFDGHTQFFAIVQLIGSRKQAENFAYRLELNGNRRRLTWEAMPRSSHEGVASAILNSDCLVFDTSIAQLFADNGNLGINVTISVV